MVILSKEDIEDWENYKLNINELRLNIKKKDVINIEKIRKNQKKILNVNTFDKFIKLLEKGKIEPDGVIDLHGLTVNNARKILNNYLVNSFNNYKRNILVITGIGLNKKGLLKKELPFWLQEDENSKIIIKYKIAPRSFGGEGAMIVRIRKKNKTLI